MVNLRYDGFHSELIRGGRNHGVTLTEDGVLFRKRAEEIVALADRTEAEFAGQEQDIHGDIYIGAGETDAMRLFARVAGSLRERHPNIRYHLFSGNAEEVSERLDKGLLDFGVLIGEAEFLRYDSLPLGVADTWGVLMREDSPLAAKNAIRPRDLWDKPLILSQQSLRHNEFSGWLGRSMDGLHIAATYNLIYNATLLVEAGVGYAITFDKLVDTTGQSPLCFRPLKPKMEGRLNLVWKKYRVFSRAAGLFLRELRASLPSE